MQQLTFETYRKSRRSDPETSKLAAENHVKNGKAASNCEKCLKAVKGSPGMTYAEVAAVACLEEHEAARRLADLKNAGLVKRGEARTCRVNGTKCKTWFLISDIVTTGRP